MQIKTQGCFGTLLKIHAWSLAPRPLISGEFVNAVKTLTLTNLYGMTAIAYLVPPRTKRLLNGTTRPTSAYPARTMHPSGGKRRRGVRQNVPSSPCALTTTAWRRLRATVQRAEFSLELNALSVTRTRASCIRTSNACAMKASIFRRRKTDLALRVRALC